MNSHNIKAPVIIAISENMLLALNNIFLLIVFRTKYDAIKKMNPFRLIWLSKYFFDQNFEAINVIRFAINNEYAAPSNPILGTKSIMNTVSDMAVRNLSIEMHFVASLIKKLKK